MKKVIVLTLVLALLCTILCISVTAVTDSVETGLTQEEIETVCKAMKARNVWGDNFRVEIVYDGNDMPNYLFASTDNGYIILSRETLSFCEGGQGNPYKQYQDSKKYYGGPISYYVDAVDENGNAAFFDLMRMNLSDSVAVVERVNVESVRTGAASTESVQADTEYHIANSDLYIRRVAFGANYANGDYTNTCSAVAACIALTYLARSVDARIVPDKWKVEDYTKIPYNEAQVKAYYPRAVALQDYIVNTCGMKAASFSAGVSRTFNKYMSLVCPDVELGMLSTPLPKESTIKGQLDQDLPVLISTTFHSTYSFHTMCVYGYRIISGNMELLVHTGWYGADECSVYSTTGGTTTYIQNEVWIDEDYAAIGYYIC